MPSRLSRYCEGIIEAGWLLALVVTPLFFNIYSSRVFEPDKVALLRSLALLVGGAWVIKALAERGRRPGSAGVASARAAAVAFFRRPLALPVAALVAVYLISTVFSVSAYSSLLGSYQRGQGLFTTLSYLVLFAAVAAHLRRRDQVERIFTTVILTSLPISLYGLLQRYRLDPLPWGGDTVDRVTSNMGNAIFVAAYLIMAVLLTLGRVVMTFRAILSEEGNFIRNMARATSYVFILAVNLVTIWFTQSRGPLLGLMAGLFFFGVLLSLHWRVRWLTLSLLGLAAATAAFLVILNLPGGPLAALTQAPTLNRLSQMFDEIQGRTGTGRVRVLIWEGVVKLMLPHPPLQHPDGRPDVWNAVRPLIGYGPESLYVAYNRFYPPELGQVEARNASPDRSHNETFDALAFTGLIGLAVHFVLFIAIFYYGLKWTGLIGSPRRRNVLLALVAGGGLISAVGLIAWQGPEFFGVGLPFGMLMGLIAFLTLAALFPTTEDSAPTLEAWRAVALVSLLAAVIAHFAEIHFGIAIVSTRTHFWVFVGLMYVLGAAVPETQSTPAPEAAAAPAAPALEMVSRRRQRASARRAASTETSEALAAWRPAYVSAGITCALLITLGYDYVSNPLHFPQTGQVLIRSLTFLPKENRTSLALLGLVLVTWLFSGALAFLEETQASRPPGMLKMLGATLWLAVFVSGFSWLIASYQLAALESILPATIPQLLAKLDNLAGVLTTYYVELLLLLLGLAFVLPERWPVTPRTADGWTVLSVLGLPPATLLLAFLLNLQPIRADILYKTGLQFDDQRQPALAIPVYQDAIRVAQQQDFYYLFLGRAYLNATAAMTDTAQRDDVMQQAEQQLLEAQALNPLNTDHSANLARLNRQWAVLTQDNPAARAARASESNGYYAQALSLSPNNAGLWNEWAILSFQVLEDPPSAQEKLDRSFALDTNYEQTYQVQGDLYAWQAVKEQDAAARQTLYGRAITAYTQGVEVADKRSSNGLDLHIGLAQVYTNLNQFQSAIDEYQLILNLGVGASQWQVYRALAELYRLQGDAVHAREYGQLAIDSAPDTEKAALQAWLDALAPSP
jgi:O-antigen ligase